MNTYQLWIKNPTQQFQPLGPPASAVDANLWYQLLLAHFGSGEVEMRPVVTPSQARVTARSQWPGE